MRIVFGTNNTQEMLEKENKWKSELPEETQEKIDQTEQAHFWVGAAVGAFATALLSAVLKKR